MIAIIDYEMGNVGSIQNMIRKFTEEVIITKDHEIIKNASK
jgi:imidazole glycerol-phosphate synthase subunit HisH